jgi:uncharacterized protein YndB with AHSA1/START domain
MNTDRIRKNVLLHAARARIWRALTNSQEFGTWFGVRFDGPFVAGAKVSGVITGTTVDPEVALLQKPHEGTPFEITVERMEPERLFSFSWHPAGAEPSTLVEFVLEEAAGGILLTVTESGFDKISLSRRAQAFKDNEQGWAMQMQLIEKYLTHAP